MHGLWLYSFSIRTPKMEEKKKNFLFALRNNYFSLYLIVFLWVEHFILLWTDRAQDAFHLNIKWSTHANTVTIIFHWHQFYSNYIFVDVTTSIELVSLTSKNSTEKQINRALQHLILAWYERSDRIFGSKISWKLNINIESLFSSSLAEFANQNACQGEDICKIVCSGWCCSLTEQPKEPKFIAHNHCFEYISFFIF